jgi:hypothetical protein
MRDDRGRGKGGALGTATFVGDQLSESFLSPHEDFASIGENHQRHLRGDAEGRLEEFYIAVCIRALTSMRDSCLKSSWVT